MLGFAFGFLLLCQIPPNNNGILSLRRYRHIYKMLKYAPDGMFCHEFSEDLHEFMVQQVTEAIPGPIQYLVEVKDDDNHSDSEWCEAVHQLEVGNSRNFDKVLEEKNDEDYFAEFYFRHDASKEDIVRNWVTEYFK
jgi:hypothetical protein